MKKVLISLSLLCTSLPAFSMDHTGGASSATAPQQQKIIVTSDGKRIPISGAVFEELRSGLFANFLCLHPKESLLATRFQNFERGSLTTADTQELWHDLAAEWDKLTLTGDGDHDFPLDIIDAHTLETLFTLAHHPEKFQHIWADRSIAQQLQLYDAADFLVLHSPLRTAIINATTHIIPAIEQLSKDEFLALLPKLRSMVTHCLPARCALAYQLAFNGIQPQSTQLPIEEQVCFFKIAPDGTLANTTFDGQLYLYNLTTETSTLIRDHAWSLTFAPDGTLAYRTDATDHFRLYLYNRTTGTSTRIRDNVAHFTFAPDGTLAYKAFDEQLYLYNPTTGNSTPIREHVLNFSFVPDGTLAYRTFDGQLYLYNPTTETSTPIRDHVLDFHFAPDGTLAYITDSTDNYRLYFYNQTTKTFTLIRDHVWNLAFAPDGTLAYTTDETDNDQLYLYNQTTGTSTPIREHVWNFTFASDETLAYTTGVTNNYRLYLYNSTTGTSTLIRDHVLDFHFAPDGTLAYTTNDTDNYRLYLYNSTTETSTLIRDHVLDFHFAPDGTLYLLANRHLLHYNFTHELDAVQQLILLFVLSHEHTGTPVTFTRAEITTIEEGLYHASRLPTLNWLLVAHGCTQKDLERKTIARYIRSLPPLPPEAKQPTAEQLREERGLKRSLLDMPEELRAHVRIREPR